MGNNASIRNIFEFCDKNYIDKEEVFSWRNLSFSNYTVFNNSMHSLLKCYDVLYTLTNLGLSL